MNPARFIHTMDVIRPGGGRDSSGQQQRGRTQVASAEPCLIEGAHGTGKQMGVGRVPRAAYVVSWGGALELRDGDLITWLERGKTFAVRSILDDTTRPSRQYFTAILTERPE